MSIEKSVTLLDYYAASAPPVPDWYDDWLDSNKTKSLNDTKRPVSPNITTPLSELARAMYEYRGWARDTLTHGSEFSYQDKEWVVTEEAIAEVVRFTELEAIYQKERTDWRLERKTQEIVSWRWYYARQMYNRREEEHLFVEMGG